jgi:Dolichyl-phosphate-mannose-protein mannosyltransferase
MTAATLTIHAPAREVAARQRLSYLIFALCFSLYLMPFMRLVRLGTDEGSLVYGAVRIVHGQVFARDFFEVMGPGTFYWLAMFFKLLGVTFLATRVCLFLTSLGTALLVYFLTRRVCRKYQLLPSVLLFATYFSGQWPAISHHVDSNFMALLSVACMIIWQESRKKTLLIFAGILAGVTTAFHQPKGLLLLASILLWLWIKRQRWSVSVSTLGLVVVGYCSFLGIVLVYFWSQHALWDLIYANFVWPFRHYSAVNVVAYAQGIVTFYWDPWVATKNGFNWSIGVAAIVITPFLFIAALPALLLIQGIRSKWSTMRPEIMLYWLCGWALWLGEFHRKDISHLVFGSPLLIILCIYSVVERQERIPDLSIQVLSISAYCLACLNLFFVLTAHPFMTRVGSVAVFKSDPVLAFLDDHVAPGQEIFAYTYSPMYYFLSSTTNPTRYSILMYGYNTRSQFEEVIRVLDEHRVRYVLWDTVQEERDLKLFFPSVNKMPAYERIIEPYLQAHYKVVWADKGVLIMERINDNHAS